MIVLVVCVYLLLCGFIAYLGRNYRLGYWGFFFLSIFLTPIVGVIALISAMPVNGVDVCRRCCEELRRRKKQS